jgi:hypothetical protein
VDIAIIVIGFMVGLIILVLFIAVKTQTKEEQALKDEVEAWEEDWKNGIEREQIKIQAREALETIERNKVKQSSPPPPPSPSSILSTIQSKQAKLQEELEELKHQEEQAKVALEEQRIKESLSKLSREELEKAYREKQSTPMDNLSQEETDALLKILAGLRERKG